ncbi:hypothetical protein GE061_001759 [Apolygus lucorum]|uniref:Uncharacterized protein n=1 Tax=Apolygus lucorum TaxID=248454 RepID=A0A8S9X4X9_APOLU|nr:hypothetical protein GE061_001759 [Apolygus lucorum]
MEYQHYGPCGAKMSKREEFDEPLTVGMVMVSERRKPVVKNDESCATATITTFPSTSPGITVVPPPTILVNEVKCDQPRTVVYPTTPKTMTATAPWEQAVADSTTPAVLTKTSLWEHAVADSATHTTLTTPVPFKQDIADPATPAMQTANSLTDVGTTSLRPAVVDTGTPAILTATPATLAATTPVEVTVADPATPEMLTTTPQTLISVEPTIADPATPAMPATLPAILPPAMPPKIIKNTIAHLQTTLNPEIHQPVSTATTTDESFKEDVNLEEWETSHPILEHPEEWELILTDPWDEPSPEFDEVVVEKQSHLDIEDIAPTRAVLKQFEALFRPPSAENCSLGVIHRIEPTQASVGPLKPFNPGSSASAPEEPSDDEDEQFIDAMTFPPQEPFTVPVPSKEERSNDHQPVSNVEATEAVPPTTQEHEGRDAWRNSLYVCRMALWQLGRAVGKEEHTGAEEGIGLGNRRATCGRDCRFLTSHQCQPANHSKYLFPVAIVGEGTKRCERDRHCQQISSGIYLTSQVHHTESSTTTLTHEANLTIP